MLQVKKNLTKQHPPNASEIKKREKNGDFFSPFKALPKKSKVAAIKHKTQWKNIQNFYKNSYNLWLM